MLLSSQHQMMQISQQLTSAMRLNLISLWLYASMRCMMCGRACT